MISESHKTAIRQQWAISDKANDLNVFEFRQFLLALDDAETNKELEELKSRWSKLGQNQTCLSIIGR
jgi:hypothetical protein